MKWIQSSESVYVANTDIVKVDVDDLAVLESQAKNSVDKRIRLCVHQDINDDLHEMFIVIARGSYVRPHKHLNKTESFHIVKGLLDVVIFDDAGNVKEIIPMGSIGSGKCFYYRLASSYFHTVVIKTDIVVFHETTNGPFKKEETIYAEWAPHPDKVSETHRFNVDLELYTAEN